MKNEETKQSRKISTSTEPGIPTLPANSASEGVRPACLASNSSMELPPRNPKALAGISTETVAKIAALLDHSPADPGQRIIMAYELLDAAESARNSLLQSGSYTHGIDEFNWVRNHFRSTRDLEREVQVEPAFFWGFGGDARLDLEKVLASFFGGKTRKIKPAERQSRFNRLVDFLQHVSFTPEIATFFFGRVQLATSIQWEKHGIERNAAEDLVKKWEREGIPGKSYPSLKQHFPVWWESQLAQINSKNRKGKIKKPLKKTDGRKGARTPTFFEALKNAP